MMNGGEKNKALLKQGNGSGVSLQVFVERTSCGFGKFGPNGFGQAFSPPDSRRVACRAHKLEADYLCQFIA
jgi:hypothetical protein